MRQKECVAMVLAGGKGERLGTLTNGAAKPAVHFGGKYRIIDFTLSNCAHSGIDTLGVLTQHRTPELHSYINNGQAWKLDNPGGGVFMLPSSQRESVYTGTANAVYQNILFIDEFDPEHVLILSSDHIIKWTMLRCWIFTGKQEPTRQSPSFPFPWRKLRDPALSALPGMEGSPNLRKSQKVILRPWEFTYSSGTA